MLAVKDFLVIPHIDNIYQIKPLKEWLKAYNSTYNKIYDMLWKSNLYEPNDTIVRLYNISTKNQDKVFINLYDEINKIVTYHQTENNFIIRMNNYKNVINSKGELEDWFIKNEGIGSCCLESFLVDFLNHKSKHLQLNIENTDGKIFIDSSNFKSTITFLELMAIYNIQQDEKLKSKVPLPNKTYPVSVIKEKFIQSCIECNPKLFYPYLQLDNVKSKIKKESYYEYFCNRVYCMKEKHIGTIRLEITKDTDDNEIEVYQFYDEKHKYSLLLFYIEETKDKFIFVDTAPF
jgi:hypothetical protein